MSPCRAKTSSTKASWVSGASASKGTVSTCAPARARDQLVEAVEQRREATRGGRDVQRERPARLREGEEPALVAEALEHGKERGGACGADPLERRPQRVLLAERHHELVLHEP